MATFPAFSLLGRLPGFYQLERAIQTCRALTGPNTADTKARVPNGLPARLTASFTIPPFLLPRGEGKWTDLSEQTGATDHSRVTLAKAKIVLESPYTLNHQWVRQKARKQSPAFPNPGVIPPASKGSNMLLITPMAAAEFLRLSKSTLAKMRITGRGPAFRKHGRSVVYEQAELERWSDMTARPSTSAISASSTTLTGTRAGCSDVRTELRKGPRDAPRA